MENAFAERFDALMNGIGGQFTKLEALAQDSPDRANLLKQIRASLNAAKYVRGLIRDLQSE